MITLEPHGIKRSEWVRRFKETIVRLAGLDGSSHADGIADAELQSWPEEDEHPVPGFEADWLMELPESAAMENLSCWTQ